MKKKSETTGKHRFFNTKETPKNRDTFPRRGNIKNKSYRVIGISTQSDRQTNCGCMYAFLCKWKILDSIIESNHFFLALLYSVMLLSEQRKNYFSDITFTINHFTNKYPNSCFRVKQWPNSVNCIIVVQWDQFWIFPTGTYYTDFSETQLIVQRKLLTG